MPAKPSPIGQVFGLLTVIEVEPKRTPKQMSYRWKCRCACGVECMKWSFEAKRPERLGPGGEMVPISCGCRLVLPDLTGQHFGKLVVQRIAPGTGEGRIAECLCDCGRTTRILASTVSRGLVQSCGCLANLKGPARGLGSRPARAGKSSKPHAPKLVAKVLALYAANVGVEEIMRRTGVSHTSVFNFRVRAGIPAKREVDREQRQAAKDAKRVAKDARDLTGKKFHKLLGVGSRKAA